MTLALAHSHAAAFNGLYYATAATVIPVLFLAIAVQGTAYQTIMNNVYAASARQASSAGWRQIALIVVQMFFTLLAFAILIAGIAGEILAIVALQDQAAPADESEIVFLALALLVAIAALGPATTYFTKTPATPSGAPRKAARTRHAHTAARQAPKWAKRAQLKARNSADTGGG